jgi:hypothetical protein
LSSIKHEIPGFWQGGPHEPFPVEAAWRDFVRSTGGAVVEDLVPQPRNFENADFVFLNDSVVAELKEIETEFTASSSFSKGFHSLMTRLVEENSNWRPELFGGDGVYPAWFHNEFLRIFRPPLQRIIKKANKQIRETKQHFNITSPKGVLFLVNDGFTSISPGLVFSLACELLVHSFTSIDVLVYLTVNRYVEIAGSDEPKLLWVTSYSTRGSDELAEFIDNLGRRWFDFLDSRIGLTSRTETQDLGFLNNSTAIVHPELPPLKR